MSTTPISGRASSPQSAAFCSMPWPPPPPPRPGPPPPPSHVYNPDFWQSLQPAEPRILLDAMARATARAQVAYPLSVQAALDGARKRGIELLAPSDDLKASLAAFNKASIANLPKAAMAARKIADPSDLIRAYLGLEA